MTIGSTISLAVAPIVWLLLGAGTLFAVGRREKRHGFPRRVNLGVGHIVTYDGTVLDEADLNVQIWAHENGDVFEIADDPTPGQIWVESDVIPPGALFANVKDGRQSGGFTCDVGQWIPQRDMVRARDDHPWLEARVTLDQGDVPLMWTTALVPGQVFGRCVPKDPSRWIASDKAISAPDILVLGFGQTATAIYASNWREALVFDNGDLIFEGPGWFTDERLADYAHDPQLGAIVMDRLGRAPRPVDVLLWIAARNTDIDRDAYLDLIGNRDEAVWQSLFGESSPRPGFSGFYARHYYAAERVLMFNAPDPFS
jgi:hypothetical protein